jgi:hypothetical protein
LLGPDDVEAQTDLVISYVQIAQTTQDTTKRRTALEEGLAIVKALEAKGGLTAEQKDWPKIIEDELARLRSEQTAAQAK